MKIFIILQTRNVALWHIPTQLNVLPKIELLLCKEAFCISLAFMTLELNINIDY